MPTPRRHYIRPHTLAFGALLVALATRPIHVIAAPIDPAELHLDLLDRADAEHDEGAYAEAAALFAKAYRARPQEQRADELGAFILRKAVAEYRLALASAPEGIAQLAEHLALLGQLTALLDDFVRARPVGDLPAFVIEAEAELERRTHALELAARLGDWPMRRRTGSSQRRADRAHATTHDFMGIPPYSTREQGRF